MSAKTNTTSMSVLGAFVDGDRQVRDAAARHALLSLIELRDCKTCMQPRLQALTAQCSRTCKHLGYDCCPSASAHSCTLLQPTVAQVVMYDTPGVVAYTYVHNAKHARRVRSAWATADKCDALLMVVDAYRQVLALRPAGVHNVVR